MLLVKTAVRPSSIAGMGLFADQDLKKGDIVWKFTPETCVVITQEQFQMLVNSFHKTERELIKYYLIYTYYQKALNGVVFCVDDGRFVNHSDQPNMGHPHHFSPEIAWQYSVALRDIKKGEELMENYNTYDPCEWIDELNLEYEVYHFQPEMPHEISMR
jgi:SET domain-containing protein